MNTIFPVASHPRVRKLQDQILRIWLDDLRCCTIHQCPFQPPEITQVHKSGNRQAGRARGPTRSSRRNWTFLGECIALSHRRLSVPSCRHNGQVHDILQTPALGRIPQRQISRCVTDRCPPRRLRNYLAETLQTTPLARFQCDRGRRYFITIIVHNLRFTETKYQWALINP